MDPILINSTLQYFDSYRISIPRSSRVKWRTLSFPLALLIGFLSNNKIVLKYEEYAKELTIELIEIVDSFTRNIVAHF